MRVVHGGPSSAAVLKTSAGTVALQGPLADELAKLQSFKVAVKGVAKEGVVTVADYTILDIGGGATPIMGLLVRRGEVLIIEPRDGGEALALSMNPRTREKLRAADGAKIWVHGPRLLSGELKVQRYGVLRERVKDDESRPAGTSVTEGATSAPN